MSKPVIDYSRHYTLEEYLALDAVSDVRLEYFDGRIVPHPDDVVRDTPQAMAGATKPYNRVVGNVRRNLENALIARQSPCEVFAEEIRVELDASGRFAYPDVVLTCDDRADDPLTARRPLLIVEVLSPSTAQYDRTAKFEAYRAIATVIQIVLLEPRWAAVDSVDSYTRNSDGTTWTLTALRELTDELVVAAADLRLPLAEIYRRVPLSPFRRWEQRELPPMA